MKRIIFTGGGTGGHVYPGLAVYDALPTAMKPAVLWIGSRHGVERGIVRTRGIPYRRVRTGKLRRYFDLKNVTDLFKVVIGTVESTVLLGRLDAAVVFSKGGFVAVPVVIAARLRGIPIVIHESDADPGLATRITAPFARVICVPYEETARYFVRPGNRRNWSNRPARRVVVTGNPVRAAFFTADSGDVLSRLGLVETDDPVILITGGSLGARQLNDWVEQTVSVLTRRAVVIHQTGEGEKHRIDGIRKRAEAGRYYGVPTFTDIFPAVLRRADMVVARAGAGTVWELAATARPAVLVPLSRGASRGDQIRNAERYRRSGCAVVIDNPTADASEFLRVLEDMLDNPGKRNAMADAARVWAGENAAVEIAGLIQEYVGDRYVAGHSGPLLDD